MDINQYTPIRLRKERKKFKKEPYTKIVPNTENDENTLIDDDTHREIINMYYNSGDDKIVISTYKEGFKLLNDILKDNLIILKFAPDVFVRLFDTAFYSIAGTLENKLDEDIGCTSVVVNRISNVTMDYGVDGELENYTATFKFIVSKLKLGDESIDAITSTCMDVPICCIDKFGGKSIYIYLLNKETGAILVVDGILWNIVLALLKSLNKSEAVEIPTMEMRLTI